MRRIRETHSSSCLLLFSTDAGSRILFGLSSDQMAPKMFSHCTKKGIPFAGIALTALMGLLAYLNVNTTGGTVFLWFANISSITGILTWWSILLVSFHRPLSNLFDLITMRLFSSFCRRTSGFIMDWNTEGLIALRLIIPRLSNLGCLTLDLPWSAW